MLRGGARSLMIQIFHGKNMRELLNSMTRYFWVLECCLVRKSIDHPSIHQLAHDRRWAGSRRVITHLAGVSRVSDLISSRSVEDLIPQPS